MFGFLFHCFSTFFASRAVPYNYLLEPLDAK